MKKAFTMIELVFVIVIIGILTAVILPNTKTNPVKEAAIQLVSHIRYTQHLAMIDDKFNINDSNWYKKRWQIVFTKGSMANKKYAYTIYSDAAGGNTGDPNISEIAKNPENREQLLTGGATGGEPELGYNDPDFLGMKKLNLGMSYGITNVIFSSSCSVGNSERLAFDHVGRPLKGKLGSSLGGGNAQAYENDNLIQTDCLITLTDDDINVIIKVVHETGYTCVMKEDGTACI